MNRPFSYGSRCVNPERNKTQLTRLLVVVNGSRNRKKQHLETKEFLVACPEFLSFVPWCCGKGRDSSTVHNSVTIRRPFLLIGRICKLKAFPHHCTRFFSYALYPLRSTTECTFKLPINGVSVN